MGNVDPIKYIVNLDYIDQYTDMAKEAWILNGGTDAPTGELAKEQRQWDIAVVSATQEQLIQEAPDATTRARLLAVSAPDAGAWLSAPPLTAAGLRMDDETVRIATGLRLGTALCAPHTCHCGAVVDARGLHGLSCQKSAGRFMRHSQLNDIIHRALIRANVPSAKEPQGLIVGSGLRPDGVSLIPWSHGKCLAWDATVPDTLAPSHVSATSTHTGSAAAHASSVKLQKYSSLQASHHVVPVAIETLGPWNVEGRSFVAELGRRISAVTGDLRETAFLRQRLSVAVQKGNAISCLGSLRRDDDS